jgi:hypothetical protein
MTELIVLPARRGTALRLAQGQRLKIVNTHGTQVVDCWALIPGDPQEHMSMPHSRNAWYRLVPRPGDPLVTNRRRAVPSTWRPGLSRKLRGELRQGGAAARHCDVAAAAAQSLHECADQG